MAVSTTGNLNVSELDFDQIKSNLKEFLEGQDEFTDYNFDGSALNAILDVLAYTTHYNAFNANMAVNESFLDTAKLRSSVVSHSKLLGYTPRSAYAPKAMIDVEVTNPTGMQNADGSFRNMVMERGTIFKTTIDGITYKFVNTETHSIPRENGKYIFTDIEIIQGEYNTIEYVFDKNTAERFVMPTDNVVTSSLIVTIKESAQSSEFDTYKLSTNLVDITNDTESYWLQEARDGFFEVYFGDGIIGKKLVNGNVITLEYVVTKGDDANGTTNFILSDTIDGNSNADVTTKDKATGGSDREDISSIKFNAPLGFVAQNRAVTPDDYKTIIQANFANIRAITVWGGEQHDPPDYGKVYVTIAPKDSDALSDNDKERIISEYLKPKNVVSITPVLLDPTYTFIHLEVFFKYNPNTTNDDKDTLEEKVRKTLEDYQENELKRFDGVFRYSKILTQIDATDYSIINSYMRSYMKKRFVPQLGKEVKYELVYAAPLHKTTSQESIISSSEFIFLTKTCTLQDTLGTDGKRIVKIISESDDILHNNIGYLIESEGKIILDGFNPASIVDTVDYIEVTVAPDSHDMAPNRNELLNILTDDAIIVGEVDTMITGGTSAGIDYTTTSKD